MSKKVNKTADEFENVEHVLTSSEAFIEKYVENPRHIEIQVIADKYGNVLHLGEKIISIAKKSDCDAIHPGYGFLSENADFARACEANGIIFIGPKPEHIELFGDKMASKVAMKKVGVPVLEGTDEPIIDIEEGAKIAKQYLLS